jgi:hypothetical protein
MSEILVGAIEPATQGLGLNEAFVGVFVVAILGNAAEHATAVTAAMRDRMDLALSVAIGSSVQVALFVAPLLVLASLFVGPAPMDLAFNGGMAGSRVVVGTRLPAGADQGARRCASSSSPTARAISSTRSTTSCGLSVRVTPAHRSFFSATE